MERACVLVLGGSGFVGARTLQVWGEALQVDAPSHAALDVLDQAALAKYVTSSPAAAVLNLSAWAGVDDAEAEQGQLDGRVYRLNTWLPEQLARLCQASGKHLVHVSTDYVFDGTNAERPYREDDPVHPLCWYAETKARGERAAQAANDQVCIARIEIPFAARSARKLDLARLCKSRLEQGQSVAGVTDQRITPVFLDDCARALAELVRRPQPGIFHVVPTTWTTPYDFARAIAGRLGLDVSLIEPQPFEVFARSRPARRPQHSWLDAGRFERLYGSGILRSVDEQLDAWVAQVSAPV